jgi:hypothetical protein
MKWNSKSNHFTDDDDKEEEEEAEIFLLLLLLRIFIKEIGLQRNWWIWRKVGKFFCAWKTKAVVSNRSGE